MAFFRCSNLSIAVLELDLGRIARGGVCFKIRVLVSLEAEHSSPDAIGKGTNVGVVIAQYGVIACARDLDAVFRSGNFILQAHELLVRLELRIVFRKRKKATKSSVQRVVGGNLILRRVRLEQARASIGNVTKDRGLLLGVTLDGFP